MNLRIKFSTGTASMSLQTIGALQILFGRKKKGTQFNYSMKNCFLK